MTNSADPDQKPTDLNLHCLLRQGMPCSAREGLIIAIIKILMTKFSFKELAFLRSRIQNSMGQ